MNIMKEKKRVFIDMDGVLCDFWKAVEEHPEAAKHIEDDTVDMLDIYGVLEPIEGAINAYYKLCEHFEVYLLSTAPWKHPKAWTDKRLWVEEHLGEKAYKNLILSHHKHLCCSSETDIMIDDRTANGVDKWWGEHIHFGQEGFENWEKVLDYLGIR
jgi:5'(3')-deoxyribonucleotidase